MITALFLLRGIAYLPANGNDSSKHTSVLCRDVREAQRCDGRPELPRILPTRRHCINNSSLCLSQTGSRQQTLHAEEVGVEARREERLIDQDLDRDRLRMRGVVEVIAQKHKPLVIRY